MNQTPGLPTVQDWKTYLVDALQRQVLFLDVLRRRGNYQVKTVKDPRSNVLRYAHQEIMNGRDFEKPISYYLLRILPPSGVKVNPRLRPVVVIDPRAGQSPGIGGFKDQSEVGEALHAGHPVYFVSFTSEPVASETFPDVVEGQVRFIEKVIELHPEAPHPFVIGNCQAGYQTLMGATLQPELYGLCMVAGSPMSYWQGQHGAETVNPMRYSGGFLGGSWLATLTSDLNGNEFDGAWLVLNFDNLNPANWLWTKQYDVYAKVDTEADRYLNFEQWWGDFIMLNGQTMEYLAEKLFVGDQLTQNRLGTAQGQPFDLRNIKCPVIVFTSLGDNISPPPQALGWIPDLYPRTEDIQAAGKTIVYCVNPHVGHLAIFVSSKVATKENEEMISTMEQVAQLPPGLYEMVIEGQARQDEGAGDRYGVGCWSSRFEPRTLDDIRRFGRNSVADQQAFAAVAALSERNLKLYKTWLQPWIKGRVTPEMAHLWRGLHPLRLSYSMFADARNPWMKPIEAWADKVRAHREPVAPDNPLWQLQQQGSDAIVQGLQQFQKARDAWTERTFFSVFGSPWTLACLGLPAQQAPDPRLGGSEAEPRSSAATPQAAPPAAASSARRSLRRVDA